MLEELLFMILRGFIIGVVVSAPMGPVGIFCIQRTLDKGRLSGFYTGMGAAVSDLIYCLLTGFCLSFIEGFINANRSPIQLFGACVLIAFGIWLVRKKPSPRVCADTDEGAPSREADILKGFALTFSNPLILFLIIGLFAQFNFVIEDMKFYHYVLGFIGIFSGALSWWWTVTYFVDKLRGHFNDRTMKMINRCVGIIILIFAALGIFDSVSAYAAPESNKFSNSYRSNSITADFRVVDSAMKGWQAEFADSLGNGFVLEVSPSAMRDAFGDNGGDVLRVEVRDRVSRELLASALAKDGIDPYRGPNSWRVARKGNVWRVLAGNREYHDLLVFAHGMGVPLMPLLSAAPGGEISIPLLNLDVVPVAFDSIPHVDVSALLLASLDSDSLGIAGVYSLFDNSYDDSYAVPGGDYRVALKPVDDGGYAMIYLSGARTLADCWHPGMRKALLKPTPFSNVFDVEWVDAEGNIMRHDVQAEFFPLSSTITVSFPYQSSSLRFRKE